jgi:hypothetical protein
MKINLLKLVVVVQQILTIITSDELPIVEEALFEMSTVKLFRKRK